MSVVKTIQERLRASESFQTLVDACQAREAGAISGTVGSGRAMVCAELTQHLTNDLIFIEADETEAKRFYADCSALLPEDQVVWFPPLGSRFWAEIGPPHSLVGRRLATLNALLDTQTRLVVTCSQAILECVASPDVMRQSRLTVHVEDTLDFEAFVTTLVEIGYVREDRVEQPGEMSIRGGLVDVYPFDRIQPVRIEFFGDQIESIREIEVDTQRSVALLGCVQLLPLSAAGPYGPADEETTHQLELTHSVLDYLNTNAHILFADRQQVLDAWQQSEEHLRKRLNESGVAKPFDALFTTADALAEMSNRFHPLEWVGVQRSLPHLTHFDMDPPVKFNGHLTRFKDEILTHQTHTTRAVFALFCDSEAQTERLQSILDEEGFPETVRASHLNLSTGFLCPPLASYVYTTHDLYNRVRLVKTDRLESRNVSFRELTELKRGDFVVHSDYGIGLYRGLERIHAYGKERECLEVEYRDGDKLYVPMEKMDCVQKYSSRDGVVPSLNKLGGKEWTRLKQKTKKDVKEIADNLIKLYAMRQSETGVAFPGDDVWQKELEASFEYEETADQLQAAQEIKKDMQQETPMDRLVCGDVGFGKTEVAIRAAFKAVNSGKQVAILVPTTVLAQQHYDTFKDRLKPYPIEVEMLSRFKSARQQKEIVKRVDAGQVDLVIGTHRLLSKDVTFKDLGLLIVDEEQKFGVLHKERLKHLKTNVDTLTLSATPIPRTLQMALVGARDMSLINTPPYNRRPVKTEVARFDRDLLREVILREINRGGQVFFVHNRVQSIYGVTSTLRELVPEVSFAVAHGQMQPQQLETIMHRFSHGEIQCLISTMIIESGIDVPNANTLIVNRADRFGLSQLYQLKGRVGRSNQQAFAYFIIPPIKKLNRTAIKRLQAIQDYSHLGSGYKIAMRDLEIRGAGNLFGAQQSGYIDALGYETYTKIIEETIQEIQSDQDPEAIEKPSTPAFDPKVEWRADAYLPKTYVHSVAERVDIYKRLSAAVSRSDLSVLADELVDRFGPLPQAAQHLIDYVAVKLLCRQARIGELRIENKRLTGIFHPEYLPQGEEFRSWIAALVQQGGETLQLKQEGDQLLFEKPLGDESPADMRTILEDLIPADDMGSVHSTESPKTPG